VKAASWLWLLVVAGCGPRSNPAEQRGDIAFHEARWVDAVAAYRTAGDSPRVMAKLADALLQGGFLTESAQTWAKLGAAEPGRVGEAAAGLVRVVRAGEEAGQQGAIAEGIAGLRHVAPGWPLGRLASRLGDPAGLSPDLIISVIPALLASPSGGVQAEQSLLELGRAERNRGMCDTAIPILEGVLRRSQSGTVHDTATSVLSWCELGTGLTDLENGRVADAERRFDRASQLDLAGGPVSRRALIGVGDARLRQADTIAARTAWQTVAGATVTPDSLTQLALLRLQAVLAPTPDTVTVSPGRP
jgi:hypothetical protein